MSNVHAQCHAVAFVCPCPVRAGPGPATNCVGNAMCGIKFCQTQVTRAFHAPSQRFAAPDEGSICDSVDESCGFPAPPFESFGMGESSHDDETSVHHFNWLSDVCDPLPITLVV